MIEVIHTLGSAFQEVVLFVYKSSSVLDDLVRDNEFIFIGIIAPFHSIFADAQVIRSLGGAKPSFLIGSFGNHRFFSASSDSAP
jgi:hypothetical protein